jgi:hypothetical protein
VAVLDHCCVDYHGDDQSDEVDDEAGQDHESWAARSSAPGEVRRSRLIVADVHVCDGVLMGCAKLSRWCKIGSLKWLTIIESFHDREKMAFSCT